MNDVYINISKSAIVNKDFGETEESLRSKYEGEELEARLKTLPTDDEREWMRIFRHDAPDTERLRRKMSICSLAETFLVSENEFGYEYNGKKITVSAPKNNFKVLKVLYESVADAVSEMIKQGCVKIGESIVGNGDHGLSIDELVLLHKLIDRFFFQTSMV